MISLTRYVLLFLLLLALLPAAHAQIGFNSPAGVTPRLDAEIYTRNGFLVQQKYRFTTDNPAAHVYGLVCPAPGGYVNDPAGTIEYPTGGGNYAPSQNCGRPVNGVGTGTPLGYEIVFESLNTEPGADRVIISDPSGNSLVFSGSTLPAPFLVSGTEFSVRFISDFNSTVGTGFRLRWRQVYADYTGSSPTANLAVGNAFQFNAQKGSVQAGNFSTVSTGDYTMSLGYQNKATDYAAIALGRYNKASGVGSIAVGGVNEATGTGAIAIGSTNIASGGYSTAMGSRMNTNNQTGAFMIGDSDPLAQGITGSGINDQFVARFLNGYYLMTCGNTSDGIGVTRTGVLIARGQNSWGSISDSTKKERLLPMNHAELLRKIGVMKLSSWNYKGQRNIRHYGPMAQDFYAAFGHDGLGQVGCDTLIYSHDFAGVTFAGVQALVRENETLKRELATVKAENAQTKATTTDLANRLNLLERAVLTWRERVSWRRK